MVSLFTRWVGERCGKSAAPERAILVGRRPDGRRPARVARPHRHPLFLRDSSAMKSSPPWLLGRPYCSPTYLAA